MRKLILALLLTIGCSTDFGKVVKVHIDAKDTSVCFVFLRSIVTDKLYAVVGRDYCDAKEGDVYKFSMEKL